MTAVGAIARLLQRTLIGVVRGYRLLLSPWLGGACRFEPTCSLYAIGALEAHGPFAGSVLAAGRLLRCHPLCRGGHDPVPVRPPRLFTSLTGPRGGTPAESDRLTP